MWRTTLFVRIHIVRYVFDHVVQRIPLIVIDEFPYLCLSNNALPSILQKVWDEKAKDGNIFLVLCGSYMSFMEKEILGSKSPLFGRRTGQLVLQPFRFEDLEEFFPNYSREKRVHTYAVVGGTPAYLQRFNDKVTVEKNIKDESKENARAGQKTEADEIAGEIALEILVLMTSCVGREERFDSKDLNFQRLQSFQGLVMHFSSFEGILADSLRAICCVRPEVMKKKRAVSADITKTIPVVSNTSRRVGQTTLDTSALTC